MLCRLPHFFGGAKMRFQCLFACPLRITAQCDFFKELRRLLHTSRRENDLHAFFKPFKRGDECVIDPAIATAFDLRPQMDIHVADRVLSLVVIKQIRDERWKSGVSVERSYLNPHSFKPLLLAQNLLSVK